MGAAISANCVILGPNQAIPLNSPFVHYPMLASTKFDGWRLTIKEGKLLSRTGKENRNVYLRKHLQAAIEASKREKVVFDGELYGDYNFPELSSIFASYDKRVPADINYHVFDMLTDPEWALGGEPIFEQRVGHYLTKLDEWKLPNVIPVEQIRVSNATEAKQLYDEAIQEGHEGLILRSPRGRYKHGRCTLREGILFKFKENVTYDAVIVGYVQGTRMKKEVQFGERKRDVRGFLERTHKQDDYELEDRIGSIIVRLKDGTEVGVGLARGMKEVTQKMGLSWANRNKFIGRWVEIKSQAVGVKDKPRMGSILRFRPDLDGMTLAEKR